MYVCLITMGIQKSSYSIRFTVDEIDTGWMWVRVELLVHLQSPRPSAHINSVWRCTSMSLTSIFKAWSVISYWGTVTYTFPIIMPTSSPFYPFFRNTLFSVSCNKCCFPTARCHVLWPYNRDGSVIRSVHVHSMLLSVIHDNLQDFGNSLMPYSF